MQARILVVNPGSTSTKVALFSGGEPVLELEIGHAPGELARFGSVMEQLPWRMALVREGLAARAGDAGLLDDPPACPAGQRGAPNDRPLRAGAAGQRGASNDRTLRAGAAGRRGAEAGRDALPGPAAETPVGERGLPGLGPLDAVIGRGGFLAPVPGGVYAVTPAMLEELTQARHGEHASNLGAFMALELAREHDCPAFVADPPVTDELQDGARLTGLPDITRRSVFHALNQRAAAREAARRLGLDYARGRFVVAHLGGGVSVGAHRLGRVVDVTNALDGEGPMSPQRCGQLPLLPVLDLLASGTMTAAGLKKAAVSASGLLAHLGTADLREAERRMEAGDERAARVYEALAYQTAKAVASMAAALEGRVQAVVLTGGMMRSARLSHTLTRLTAWLGPVVVVPGEREMAALAENARLALAGALPVQPYPPDAS